MQSTTPDAWAMLLLPLGGTAGAIGLFLTTRLPQTLAGYRIMMLCIVIGIATAIVTAGGLIGTAGPDDSLFRAFGVLVLAMPILAAFGRVARLWRLRAAEGRAQDALPLIFLAVAFGALACAITIGVHLALAS